ncbi:MAG: hypothetical protein SFU27_09405 [Thermonemataceae bacterium]|nr:hypothetical protein [Thermonemataceae bacterium]
MKKISTYFTISLMLFALLAAKAQNNVALGKPAIQSSTKGNKAAEFGADKIVDGKKETFNTTEWENSAWVQVDLQGTFQLQSLTIETNEFGQESPLENFVVILSNYEIPSRDFSKTGTEELLLSAVLAKEQSSPRKGIYTVDLENSVARWVRVQTKKGGQPLRIRELTILGTPTQTSPPPKKTWAINLALDKTAEQSSVKDNNVAKNAVDADDKTIAQTEWFKYEPWWQVDLGNRYEINEIYIHCYWEDLLAEFIVMFSDVPFPKEALDYDPKLLDKVVVKTILFQEKPQKEYRFSFNPTITARYVRIQRLGKVGDNRMEINNVKIIGNPNPITSPPPSKMSWEDFFSKGKSFNMFTQGGADAFEQQNGYQQITPIYQNGQLTIGWRDYHHKKARISQYQKQGSNFVKVYNKIIPQSLELLGGITSDGKNFYALTTNKEDMGRTAGWEYRPNVFEVVKLDNQGNLIWKKDLNTAEYMGNYKVYSPMAAGTAAIVYGNNQLGIISSSNVGDVDPKINVRHQAAFRLSLSAEDGSAGAKSHWYLFRHSFNQRGLFDGKDFVFMDLGDVGFMPACGINISKISTATKTHINASYMGIDWYIFARNGNGNFTSINMADIRTGTNGYIAAFAAPKNPDKIYNEMPRNLAVVHIVKDFENQPMNTLEKEILIKNSLIDTKTKNPNATGDEAGKNLKTQLPFQTTGIAWLTNYTNATVGRPKMHKFNDNKFVLVWEKWGVKTNEKGELVCQNMYQSTKAMLVDEYGNILKPEFDLGNRRLSPRDELFTIDEKVCWIEDDARNQGFKLIMMDENFGITETFLAF